jgi:protein SMG6
MHNLLEISLAPSVPASLCNIPTKYNIIIQLYTHAFHKLFESLCRASFASVLALEHLQDFIYYAYTFYTGLLEEQTLRTFRAGWLEALDDLARYRMAVAAMVTGPQGPGPEELTTAAVSAVLSASPPPSVPPSSTADHLSNASTKSSSTSEKLAACVDDSPSPSVGLEAAKLLNVEPEKERWRCIARDWYAQRVADTPGTGKLHLGLLSREKNFEPFIILSRGKFQPSYQAELILN